jgi:predicted CopG family antitoxin
MQKKLTITIDELVYHGLHSIIGDRKISKFIEQLVAPYVVKASLDAGYKAMAQDAIAEAEAYEWIEGCLDGGSLDEAR